MKPIAIKSILAPTDMTDSTLPALRYARVFADRLSARLTIMYSEPIAYPVDSLAPVMPVFVEPTPEEQARLRGDVAKHAAPAIGDRPYEVCVTVGQPIPAILASAKERKADLIVMGTHLRHGWRRALLGSVSEGVVHAANCPVLTVASPERRFRAAEYEITHILCPINYTEVARESVGIAARLAQAFGARLTIVHALEGDGAQDVGAEEQRIRQWVGQELNGTLEYRGLVVRGGPAERVLDCADDLAADLLVVGAQHKLFRDTAVIGTTTERLIRFASCPVLLVPRQPVVQEEKSEMNVSFASCDA
jgi:nucleotide-binding universal stress UspA family protein